MVRLHSRLPMLRVRRSARRRSRDASLCSRPPCPTADSRCPKSLSPFRMAPAVACPRARRCAPSPRPSRRASPRRRSPRTVDDRLVDLDVSRSTPTRRSRIVTNDGPGGAARLPSLDGAPAGGGGHEPVPRHAVRHRPGDRRGLLLRLRRRAAVRPRGPRAHRSARCASSRSRTCPTSSRSWPKEEARAFFGVARRAAEGAADRREDRGPDRGLLLHHQGPRPVRGLLPRPARAVHAASSRRSSC